MRKHAFLGVTLLTLALASVTGAPPAAEPIIEQVDGLTREQHAAVGRWDITVHDPAGDYPSWLEITNRDGNLTGRFVGRAGNARPVEQIHSERNRVRFALAPQYEARMGVLRFLGTLEQDRMSGQTTNDQGEIVEWTAVRAPTLERERPARWGAPLTLVNPDGLAGWRTRGAVEENCWEVMEGTLSTSGPCTDLVTERTFKDFKLTLEFMVPHGSDSGVHLRGRYEIQLKDDDGGTPEEEAGRTGGLFGFLPPLKQAARAPGEWQTLEATLVGRTLTVVLNGETVIDAQQVPGITGDALDSNEAAAGPIMLQGYLGPVSYRNIVITPAIYEL